VRTVGRPRRRPVEHGSATLLAVSVLGLLLLVGAALAVVAVMVHAHRVAQSAADLSALAGAGAWGRGHDPCTVAAAVAADNGASLTSCTVEGLEVVVGVNVAGPHWLGQTHDLAAAARAGPARPSG